jgi:hypothetical protein
LFLKNNIEQTIKIIHQAASRLIMPGLSTKQNLPKENPVISSVNQKSKHPNNIFIFFFIKPTPFIQAILEPTAHYIRTFFTRSQRTTPMPSFTKTVWI